MAAMMTSLLLSAVRHASSNRSRNRSLCFTNTSDTSSRIAVFSSALKSGSNEERSGVWSSATTADCCTYVSGSSSARCSAGSAALSPRSARAVAGNLSERKHRSAANLDIGFVHAGEEHFLHALTSRLAERFDRGDPHRRLVVPQMIAQRIERARVPILAERLRRGGANPDVAVFE